MAKAVLTPGAAVKAQQDSYNFSITQLAEGIKLSPSAARLLINNKLPISAKIALRLSKYFGKTPEYWIGLQTAFDLAELAKNKDEAAILRSVSKAVKAPVKKAPAKKAVAKKTVGKKTPGRKPAAKKVAAKKAPAKKAAAKKTPKAAAKRAPRKAAPKPAPMPASPAPIVSWPPTSAE